jgi:putative transcriptional regulator
MTGVSGQGRDLVAIGETLAQLRRDAGLTQEELARRADVGRSTVQNVERAYKEVGTVELRKIAEALGTTLEALQRVHRFDVYDDEGRLLISVLSEVPLSERQKAAHQKAAFEGRRPPRRRHGG